LFKRVGYRRIAEGPIIYIAFLNSIAVRLRHKEVRHGQSISKQLPIFDAVNTVSAAFVLRRCTNTLKVKKPDLLDERRPEGTDWRCPAVSVIA